MLDYGRRFLLILRYIWVMYFTDLNKIVIIIFSTVPYRVPDLKYSNPYSVNFVAEIFKIDLASRIVRIFIL